ncbi:MAG: CPBP family intramembrane metalloprotease [Lachnospiraceae bacterium]|nr:CPBP family intramembrane metalloprotease [Lachnospiraceae bacterium]
MNRFAEKMAERQKKGVVPEELWLWILLPLLGICFSAFMNLLLALLGVTLTEDPVAENDFMSAFQNKLVLVILIEAVVAPVLEELLFRRVMFGLLRKVIPVYVAALIVSAVFGVLHFNLPQGLYGFFFGFLLCEVMILYGTWIAPLIVHAAANALALFMNYVPSVNEWAVRNSLTIVIVSGLLTAGLIVLMELTIRKKALREEG